MLPLLLSTFAYGQPKPGQQAPAGSGSSRPATSSSSSSTTTAPTVSAIGSTAPSAPPSSASSSVATSQPATNNTPSPDPVQPPTLGLPLPGDQPSQPVILWPTLTPAGDAPGPQPLHKPSEKDTTVLERARLLDALLVDAVQDLGLVLDLAGRSDDPPPSLRDSDLVDAAAKQQAWIISPRIEREGSEYVIRIIAVPPKSKLAMVRVERVRADEIAVRSVVMLRDIVLSANNQKPSDAPKPGPAQTQDTVTPARSPGRAVLSVSTAAFGGFSGFAMQKAGGGDDPRLLYPLLALGTGVGLGAATLVAEEWDISVGDAWFLTAGTWWPTSSALLLTSAYNIQPSGDRYMIGMLSGLGGAGLASAALSRKDVSEGGAALTHSAAGMGAFLGGALEMTVRGKADVTPLKGAGYGAAGGLLLGAVGAMTLNVPSTSSRILLIDVGAGLGALGGAAAASPLLLDNPSAGQQRAWVLSTLAGAGAGVALTLLLTRPTPAKTPHRIATIFDAPMIPQVGVIGWSTRPRPDQNIASQAIRHSEEGAPVLGMQWGGSW